MRRCRYVSWIRGILGANAPTMRYPIRRLFAPKPKPESLPVVITPSPWEQPAGSPWDDAADDRNAAPRCSEAALLQWEQLLGQQ